jgi:hypothetical protein
MGMGALRESIGAENAEIEAVAHSMNGSTTSVSETAQGFDIAE